MADVTFISAGGEPRCNACGDRVDDVCQDGRDTCASKKWAKSLEEKANAKAAEDARLRAIRDDDPDLPLAEIVRRAEQRATDAWNAERELPVRPWHADLPDSATLIRALVERGTLQPFGTEREIQCTDEVPDCGTIIGGYRATSLLMTVRVRRTYFVDSLEVIASDGLGRGEWIEEKAT